MLREDFIRNIKIKENFSISTIPDLRTVISSKTSTFHPTVLSLHNRINTQDKKTWLFFSYDTTPNALDMPQFNRKWMTMHSRFQIFKTTGWYKRTKTKIFRLDPKNPLWRVRFFIATQFVLVMNAWTHTYIRITVCVYVGIEKFGQHPGQPGSCSPLCGVFCIFSVRILFKTWNFLYFWLVCVCHTCKICGESEYNWISQEKKNFFHLTYMRQCLYLCG